MRIGRDVARTLQEGVRAGAVLFSDLFPLVSDRRDSLVPADLLPLALAALSDAFHRVLQPVLVVHPQGVRKTAVTQASRISM